MRLSSFLVIPLAILAIFVNGICAYSYSDAEIAEFEQIRDIRVGIENYLQKEIYPPRVYRSSTITNLNNSHGELDQKITVDQKQMSCSVKLAFSKGRIVWEIASNFLVKSVEEILAICRYHKFYPNNITISLFTDNTKLVGTGRYSSKDNMIRAIPSE